MFSRTPSKIYPPLRLPIWPLEFFWPPSTAGGAGVFLHPWWTPGRHFFFLKNQCSRHVFGVENDFQQRELVLKVKKRVLKETRAGHRTIASSVPVYAIYKTYN